MPDMAIARRSVVTCTWYCETFCWWCASACCIFLCLASNNCSTTTSTKIQNMLRKYTEYSVDLRMTRYWAGVGKTDLSCVVKVSLQPSVVVSQFFKVFLWNLSPAFTQAFNFIRQFLALVLQHLWRHKLETRGICKHSAQNFKNRFSHNVVCSDDVPAASALASWARLVSAPVIG